MRHTASCDITKRDCVNIFWPWSKQRWQTTCNFWHTRPLWQTNPYHGVKVMYCQPPPSTGSSIRWTTQVLSLWLLCSLTLHFVLTHQPFFYFLGGSHRDRQAIFPKCEHKRCTRGVDVQDCRSTSENRHPTNILDTPFPSCKKYYNYYIIT